MIIKNFRVLIKPALVAVLVLALAGCARHLTLQQCKSTNWYQVGYNDGVQGQYQRSLQRDIKDCEKFKLTVDTKAYSKGWRAGTRAFCVPSTAYRLGVSGSNYNNVCPKDLVKPFAQSWRRGLRRYCVPSTGYSLGRAGKPIPSFCSASQVVPFRNAYNTGFRRFQRQAQLRGQINAIATQIALTQGRINQQRQYINDWNNQIAVGFPNLPPRARRRNMRALRGKINLAQSMIGDYEQQLDRYNAQQNNLQAQISRIPD